MNPSRSAPRRQTGSSMIEVLVTMVILLVGLLGLAGLQMHGLRSEMESYQRVHALILLQDMAGRINANRANVAAYVANDIGTLGDGQPADCTGLAGQLRDSCEWSNALKGAAEVSGAGAGATNVGAMIGARGCIAQISATQYQVTVAWQGLGRTFANTILLCGQGEYGDETQRRVVSLPITIATLL